MRIVNMLMQGNSFAVNMFMCYQLIIFASLNALLGPILLPSLEKYKWIEMGCHKTQM